MAGNVSSSRSSVMIRNVGVQARVFSSNQGPAEHFIVLEGRAGAGGFEAQVQHLAARYRDALAARGLTPRTAVFHRVFVSDLLNQRDVAALDAFRDGDGSPVACSFVQQPPLSGAKVALLAYHIDDPTLRKTRIDPHHLLVERGGARYLWSTGLASAAPNALAISAEDQTRAIFDQLIDQLSRHGASLAAHCQRTWLFVKDVDVFYEGMVQARTKLFEDAGLTRDTHYISSTGIEGAGAHPFAVVTMDAYSCLDLAAAQVSYLHSDDMLCRTDRYQVTFERGTEIAYGDRRHALISGTASIDHDGHTLHVGDVEQQCDRAIDNIAALLGSKGAGISDLQYAIVYLRDASDYAKIHRRLRHVFANVPTVIVQGAVCRPAWLIEIEGVAAVAHDDPALPRF